MCLQIWGPLLLLPPSILDDPPSYEQQLPSDPNHWPFMFYPPATRTFEDIVGLKRKRQDTEYFDSYDTSDVSKYEHPVRNGHSARSSGSSRCSISSGASSDTLDIKATYDGLLLRLPELVSHRYSRTSHDQLHSARCHTPLSAGQIADQAILHDLVGFACQGAVLVMQTELPVTSALGSDTRRHSPLSTARQYPSYSTFHSLPKHPVQRYPQALEIAHNDFDHSCLHHETTFQRYSDHQRSPMASKRYDGLPPYSQMHQPISERRNDSAAASLEELLNGSRGFETDHLILGRLSSNTPHHLPQVLPPANRFERRTMGSNVGPPPAKAAVRCLNCDKRETPEWRKGPYGPRTLCNACGLVWAKIQKKRAKDASITAKTNGATAIHHTALHPLTCNQPSQV